jgi:enediyne biosynthesis protein E4
MTPAARPSCQRSQSRLTGLVAVVILAAAANADPAGLASAPLAARSGPRGPTLFATLPPAQTGLKAFNAYDDPAMWGHLYPEFNTGAIGTGVAIADYDGDGRPDVFVVSKCGPNHLFRNLGGFRFADATGAAGVAGPAGPWKQGAAFADVDNDGRPDLYVCRFGAPNLLFMNQGDGTFREEAAARGLALADASNMAAFADYDRDGWLDVYVQTNVLDAAQHPDGQRDHLYHNNRDGTFTEVTRAAGIAGETKGHSATWWDFDEDGWPDLYVANDFKEPDQLYRNNRNGTFTDVLSAVVPHTPHFAMGADLGDLDNDGHLDLLVADMAATSRYKDNRGMATLRSALPEDDRHPDAAPQYLHSALYLGTGTGRVLEAARLAGLAATDWTFGVRLEDLDLDGHLDAYFTNGMAREFNNSDLVQRGANAAAPAERIRIFQASPVMAERHLAFRNLGDLRFEPAGPAWGLDHLGVGFGAAFGDLDGDGDLDLVFASYDGELTACRNDADTGHALVLDLRGTLSNRSGYGATVRLTTTGGTQVRTLTAARGYLSTSEPAVHFGLGADAVVQRLVVDWPSGRRQTFTNLAADRRYTVTEPADAPVAPAPGRPVPLFVECGRAAGLDAANRETPAEEPHRQTLAPLRFSRPGPALAVADLDQDGREDLALGGGAGEPGRLLTNLGGGQFMAYGANVFARQTQVADGPILAFDADGDGDLDLLVTKAGDAAPAGDAAYQPQLWINDGRGRFTAAPAGLLPGLPVSAGAAAAADFEHSGRLALFIGGRLEPGRYPEPPRSALLAWRAGRYVDVTADTAPALARGGLVTAALWSDVDADGWADLIVAYDWGRLACYRNLGGQRLEEATARFGFDRAGTGWWRSLAAADFNGDGRLDYAAGNLGLNTRYHASPAEPALLYANVRIDNLGPKIIEAQSENGRWYPLRPRDTLVRAIPALARRFPTAESFARATLADVFSGPLLATATKLAATELRSGVFLSQPDGTFRFSPLPRRAQIAPVHGLVAGDFDGDGRADLLLVGNSFAPVPETGRFDGGLGWLLLGDGAGNFAPAAADHSGLVVPGDARALAALDLNQDGWPDAVATRSSSPALAFLNLKRPARGSFAVSLHGPAGNPTAVGARLTLRLADGTSQTAEVAAGSGHLTQSSASVFFGYPQSAPPTALQVHWPDGRETDHPFTATPPAQLRLTAP